MRAGLVLALISLLTGCGPSLAPSPAGSPAAGGAGPSAASATRITPPPVTPPTPPGTDLPAFACADASGGKTGVANFTAARVGAQTGYDRFVMQFDSIVPTYSVKRLTSPTFTMGASGQPVTLAGTAGVEVKVHSATGGTSFTGSTDILTPNNPVIKEARQTQDFEGYVSWGVGVSQLTCMRVFVLDNPARLVVDFQLPAS